MVMTGYPASMIDTLHHNWRRLKGAAEAACGQVLDMRTRPLRVPASPQIRERTYHRHPPIVDQIDTGRHLAVIPGFARA
jgi:hypothetical protein